MGKDHSEDIDYTIGLGWVMHTEFHGEPHMIVAFERIKRDNRSRDLMLMLFDKDGIVTTLIDNRISITDTERIVDVLTYHAFTKDLYLEENTNDV